MAKSDKKRMLQSLFGTIGSILIGLAFFKSDIFNYQYSAFQFVIYGLFGSIFYVYGEKVKDGLILFLIYILVDLLLAGSGVTLDYFISHSIGIAALLLAVFIYRNILKTYKKTPLFIRGFILSIGYAIISALSVLLIFIILKPLLSDQNEAMITAARTGALIGIGLGIGFDFFVFLERKKML